MCVRVGFIRINCCNIMLSLQVAPSIMLFIQNVIKSGKAWWGITVLFYLSVCHVCLSVYLSVCLSQSFLFWIKKCKFVTWMTPINWWYEIMNYETYFSSKWLKAERLKNSFLSQVSVRSFEFACSRRMSCWSPFNWSSPPSAARMVVRSWM